MTNKNVNCDLISTKHAWLKQAFEIEIVRFCFFQKKKETTVTEVNSLKITVVTVFRANFTRRIVDALFNKETSRKKFFTNCTRKWKLDEILGSFKGDEEWLHHFIEEENTYIDRYSDDFRKLGKIFCKLGRRGNGNQAWIVSLLPRRNAVLTQLCTCPRVSKNMNEETVNIVDFCHVSFSFKSLQKDA